MNVLSGLLESALLWKESIFGNKRSPEARVLRRKIIEKQALLVRLRRDWGGLGLDEAHLGHTTAS
jgi:hypothetical protein